MTDSKSLPDDMTVVKQSRRVVLARVREHDGGLYHRLPFKELRDVVVIPLTEEEAKKFEIREGQVKFSPDLNTQLIDIPSAGDRRGDGGKRVIVILLGDPVDPCPLM